MTKKQTTWKNRIVGHGEEAASSFLANPNNWRVHPRDQQEGMKGALDTVGWVQDVIVNRRTSEEWGADRGVETLVDGHLRVTLALREGDQTPVPVKYVDLTPAEEAQVLATFDPIAARAATDKQKLDELLQQVKSDDQRVQQMLSDLAAKEGMYDIATQEQRDAIQEARGETPVRDIDLIWTQGYPAEGGSTQGCCLATRSGWLYGIQSTNSCWPCPMHDKNKAHKITFIDNEFKFYEHSKHLDWVKKYRPKYCTVRDIMSGDQCTEAKIECYPFDQIMDWAEELAEYAENVIVIPKIDVIDQIPEKFMLGYSVPTSYGGTPLPIEAFRGRRVHLLGGSPNKQIAFWQRIPNDVVSLDNNYILKTAQYGQVWCPDGKSRSLNDIGIGDITNPLYTALSISLGYFAAFFKKTGDPEAQVQSGEAGETD